MAKLLKLPENLKSWKINSLISDNKDNETYKVSKRDYDGTVINAVLRHISVKGESYSADEAAFIDDEAKFLKTVSQSGNKFNYIDIQSVNNPAKGKTDLYIITEDLTPLSEIIDNKEFTTSEIVDFGIQMSAILESLEAKNIYHGNLTPENIFLTNDGTFKLGGFSDFESRISDFSFVAPEIYNKKDADFTTDIYSLGLIMYYMSNDRKLPFESNGLSRKDAVRERLSGKSVSAPANGNEKLKSVIVIACQPQNDNRWKNAGNIKNALTSIRSELPITDGKPENSKVIVPETTDFDNNVFEEYEYEDFNESTPDSESSEDTPENSSSDSGNTTEILEVQDAEQSVSEESLVQTDADISDNHEENNFELIDVSSVESVKSNDISSSSDNKDLPENQDIYSEPKDNNEVITNDVFDNYEVGERKIKPDKPAESKDYGDYFDESEPSQTIKPEPSKSNFDVDDNGNLNAFEDDFVTSSENSDSANKRKKNIIIIIVCVIIMLAALGFIAFCIINGFGGDNPKNETTAPTTASQAETTSAPTTVPNTTAEPTTQPTTVSQNVTVTPVVGYGYSYAKKLLEEAGFTVEIGEYKYSYSYDEGYVIAQSPEGDTNAAKGTVVTLDISLGIIEEETTEPPATEEPQNTPTNAPSNSSVTKTDSSYIFANSNTSYLSKSDISSLSNENLNLAINEIYARRGRIFTTPNLAEYFGSKTWYTPKYSQEEFDKNVEFNSYEQANLQLMVNEQKSRGLR